MTEEDMPRRTSSPARQEDRLAGALCLITGGAGYVGFSLARELVRRGARVRRLFRAGKPAPPAELGVEDAIGDITLRSDLERAADGADFVFHLAGQTSIYVAAQDPERDFELNVRPMLRLIDLGARRPAPFSLIFAGSATEVGLTTELPVPADPPDAPVTYYDLHKLMAEQYLELAARTGVLRGTTLRLCNVYGPGPPSSKNDRGILNQMLRRALRGESLTLYGKGEQVRDYVFVEDVARAFADAALHDEAASGKHFVIGTGTGHRLTDAVHLLAELVGRRNGRPVAVVEVEPPATLASIEYRSFVADPEPFFQATGFRASIDLKEGIARTLESLMLSAEPTT